MPDYSHYGECKTLMTLYQKRHMQRLYALLVLVMMNLYFYMPFLITKYLPTSLTAYYAMQPEEQKGITNNIGTGIPILFVCAVMIKSALKQQEAKKKWGLLFGSIALVSGMMIYIQGQKAEHHIDNGVNFQNPAFSLGIVTVLLVIGCAVTAFLAEQKRPVAMYILLGLLLVGLISKLFAWWCAVPLLIVYLTEIPEIRKMKWIMEQEGYPYFNERFSEQLENNEYVPMHKLDGKKSKQEEFQKFTETFGAEGEMPSVSLDDVPELSDAEDLKQMREQAANPSKGSELQEFSEISQKNDFSELSKFPESSGIDTSVILAKPTE